MSLLFVILAGLQSVEAHCPATVAILGSDVEKGVAAFREFEWEDFTYMLNEVGNDLECLEELIDSDVALDVHVLYALSAVPDEHVVLAKAAWRGVLSLDSGFEPESSIAATGSFLRDAFDTAAASSDSSTKRLVDGKWFIDGTPGASEVPIDRTAVVQLLDDLSGIRTFYMMGGGQVPVELAPFIYSEEPDLTPWIPPASPPTPEPERRTSVGLLVGGLACVAVGAGGVIYGHSKRDDLEGANSLTEADKIYKRAFPVTLGGHIFGGVGGGLVLSAVFVNKW